MNIIKTAFLVALFNYFIVGAIVLAFKKNITIPPVATPIILDSPTQIPKISTIVPIVSTQDTAPAPTSDTRCIIAVDGIRFDISQYRNLHSGGDIFQCGTDMSIIFHDRHPDSFLNKMSQYKI